MEFLNNSKSINKDFSHNIGTDLTRKLIEVQSKGISEIYKEINENISISKIIEKSERFRMKEVSEPQKLCFNK